MMETCTDEEAATECRSWCIWGVVFFLYAACLVCLVLRAIKKPEVFKQQARVESILVWVLENLGSNLWSMITELCFPRPC